MASPSPGKRATCSMIGLMSTNLSCRCLSAIRVRGGAEITVVPSCLSNLNLATIIFRSMTSLVGPCKTTARKLILSIGRITNNIPLCASCLAALFSLGPSWLSLTADARSAQQFYYSLSSKGPGAKIIFYSGLDSADALIIGQIQAQDAQEFCDRDPGGQTVRGGGKWTIGQCVEEILNDARGEKYYARANCIKNTLSDRGRHYAIASKEWDSEYKYWEVLWVESRSGAVLDGSEASGAPNLTRIYRVTCPGDFN